MKYINLSTFTFILKISKKKRVTLFVFFIFSKRTILINLNKWINEYILGKRITLAIILYLLYSSWVIKLKGKAEIKSIKNQLVKYCFIIFLLFFTTLSSSSIYAEKNWSIISIVKIIQEKSSKILSNEEALSLNAIW